MHPQKQQVTVHVEEESNDWTHAFNLYIGIGSLFEYLVSWFATDSPNIDDPETPLQPSINTVTTHALEAVLAWQDIFYSDDLTAVSEGVDGVKMPDTTNRAQSVFVFNGGPVVRTTNKENDVISFHLPLHRFYAVLMKEWLARPEHLPHLETHLLSNWHNGTLSSELLDVVLSNLAIVAQVTVGLWRRNGQSMQEQVLNYSGPPFCKIYRDLDLILIQLVTSASCNFRASNDVHNRDYGYNLVTHLLHRYQLIDLIRYNRTQNNLTPLGKFSRYVQLCEEKSKLLDQLLLLVINLISEVPVFPHDDLSVRLAPRIRKILVHRLVIGPCTYSQLMDSIHFLPEHNKLETQDLTLAVEAVSVPRDDNGLDPTKYILRPELWSEYDFCYPYISQLSHNGITESRPRVNGKQPMVKLSPPQEIHPLLVLFREDLATDSILITVLREVVHLTLAQYFKSGELAAATADWKLQYSGSLFARTLQLLTICVQVVLFSDNQLLRNRLATLFVEEDLVDSVSCSDDIEESEVINKPITTTLISSLMDLHDILSTSSTLAQTEHNYKCWLGWLIDQCMSLSDDLGKYISHRTQLQLDEKSLQEKEIKKRRAREKAMKSVKSSAQSFAKLMEQQQLDVDEDVSLDKDAITCVICKSGSDDRFGYLSLVQASRLLPSYCSQTHFHPDSATLSVTMDNHAKREFIKTQPDLHVSFCGHGMHYACFDMFLGLVLQHSDLTNGLILDTRRGQFQCPLCKRLNNALVPAFRRSSESTSEVNDLSVTMNNEEKSVEATSITRNKNAFNKRRKLSSDETSLRDDASNRQIDSYMDSAGHQLLQWLLDTSVQVVRAESDSIVDKSSQPEIVDHSADIEGIRCVLQLRFIKH